MSAHADAGQDRVATPIATGAERELTLRDAAALVRRDKSLLKRAAQTGAIETRVDGVRLVRVRELIRAGWLDEEGRPFDVEPGPLLGGPLLRPLDLRQRLSVAEISAITGISTGALNSRIYDGRIDGELIVGYPGAGSRRRRVIAVAELLDKGLLTTDGRPARPSARPPRRPRARGSGSTSNAIAARLPQELDDPQFGIDDRELAQLVQTCWSRLLAADRSRRGTNTYRALRLLRVYAHTEVVRAGVTLPAPCPDLDPELRIPTGDVAERALDTTQAERHALWERLLDADPVTAAFPVHYLAHFVPPPLWRVLAALIRDGPVVSSDRLRRVVFAEAQRPISRPWKERREGATPSPATIRGYVSAFRQIYRYGIVQLQAEGYPSRHLDAWTFVPLAPRVRVPAWRSDRSAPSRAQLRAVWRTLDSDAKGRLARSVGMKDGIEELRVLSEAPRYRLRNQGAFRALRTRAIFALFCVTGGRLNAIMSLDRGDYVDALVDVRGERSPAISLRPGKVLAPDEVRWKPLPHELGEVLEAYLLGVERLVGRPLRPEEPLFISALADPPRRYSAHAISNVFSGQGAAHGVRPLLPKGPHSLEEIRAVPASEVDPDVAFRGYSPQTLRRAALQLTRFGAQQYCRERDLEIDPECVSEVLLDHQVRSDRFGYADISTQEGRIVWAKVAIAVNWELLTTDRGARRAPDVARCRRLLELPEALEGELQRGRAEVEELFDARYRGVSDELVVEIMVAVHRLGEIETRLREVGEELMRLRHDRTTWRIVPDDEQAPTVDLDAITAEYRDPSRQKEPAAPVRDWITVSDLGLFAGSPATARRWIAGRLPFSQPGDPRNPWRGTRPPIDTQLGTRRKRIPVAALNPSLFGSSARREHRDRLLARMPARWPADQCRVPLAVASAEGRGPRSRGT